MIAKILRIELKTILYSIHRAMNQPTNQVVMNAEQDVQIPTTDTAAAEVLDNIEDDERDDVMVLHEEVDMKALRIIRDNFKIVYERLGSTFSEFNRETSEWVEVDFKTAATIINQFYDHKKETNKVQYSYGRKLKSGRRFAPLSLQNLCRPLRHTIAKGLFHDSDMKNAHPTFLKHLVEKLEFNHPVLDKYIDNRDELLSTWIGTTNIYKAVPSKKVPGEKASIRFENTVLKTKDDVKKYFLTVLNGGGTDKTTCAELNEFYTTHQQFLDVFYKHPDYKKYKFRADNKYKTPKKEKETETDKAKKDNRRGTCLNYYMCDIENVALSHIERYLISRNIKYGTLCFDGLMIYKRDVDDIDELLRALEEVLLEKMGFAIKLSEKIMDEDIDISDLHHVDDVKLTEQDYALHLLKELTPILKYDAYQKQLYVYNSETALWAPQKVNHLCLHLTRVLDLYIERHPDEKERTRALTEIRRNSTQLNIIAMAGRLIDVMDDTQFIMEHFDCAKGFLPIANNQVIDLKTNIVRPRMESDYFTKTTDNTIVTITEEERAIVMKYFYDWLNTDDKEYVECLLKCIAYIFSGETYLKAIFNFIGKRDGGKSTFLDMLSQLLGPFYCIANERLFINQKNKAVHDSEMFNLLNKRMATLSETKKTQSYNTTLMKAISGNDKQNIRGAGEKQTIDVLFRCILAIATNEPCKFDDDAFASRLWCFNFSNTFERNDSFVGVLTSRKNLIFTIIAEYAQKFYADKVTKVPQVDSFTKEVCSNQNSVHKWCKSQRLVKTNNKHDHVENTQLFIRYSSDCQENKWHETMKIYGKSDFHDILEDFYGLDKAVQIKRKVDGREVRPYVYRGLKDTRLEEEEVEE